ncbi:MAG: hypothetical protein K8L97_32510 [Anaerolineae bacterium]|nr:hypothetical protein [Anaerolineae bacterium]
MSTPCWILPSFTPNAAGSKPPDRNAALICAYSELNSVQGRIMTQTNRSITMVAGFTALVSFFFYMLMIAFRLELDQRLLYTVICAALTAALAATGPIARSYLQQRTMLDKKQADDSLDSRQQRTVEIDLPFNAAFDLTLDALETLDGQNVPVPDDPLLRLESLLAKKQYLRLYETDREMGSIRAGLYIKTLGIPDPVDFSRIEIRLQRLDADTTLIRIDSKGNALFENYDLGKNLHYVKLLAQYLRRESHVINAESHLAETDLPTTKADFAEPQNRANNTQSSTS